jgi:hypothetical protein
VPAAPHTSDPPARVSFPRGAWIALGLFGLTMIGLLGVQLALIEDQRSTTDRQLKTAVRQANAALPLIEDAQPLVEQLRGDAPAIRRFGRDAARLTKELTPLVRGLNDARADEQLRAAGALARTLLNADVGSTTIAVRRLSANLLSADLPSTARALDGFLRRARDQRLVELSARAARAVPQDIVPTLDRSLRVQQQAVAALRESLAIQRATLDTARETLAVARQTEQHAESIDRKTGGPVPAVPPVR